ncbi:hypothetical protein ACFVT1_01505 [Streptomyces sp. NPDC057963]|uniref:hypothetical protein n=1 Tax=Streptomyces sp. NPDC057963 TaxID=3346290 RepID=UPI0036E20485
MTSAPAATITTGTTSAARQAARAASGEPSAPLDAIPYTAVTAEIPTAEPHCVEVCSSPRARPCSRSGTPSVAAIVSGP